MNLEPGMVIEDRHGTWRVVGEEVADRRAGEYDLLPGRHPLIKCEDVADPARSGYLRVPSPGRRGRRPAG